MTSEKTKTRRRYDARLKAQILAECDAPGASVAKVAMSHGNDNVVHRRPLDLRAGTEAALARVVTVFGAARPHHAYPQAAGRERRHLAVMKSLA